MTGVHLSRTHSLRKQASLSIRLLAGLGVEGDAHAGETVQHRARVARDPRQPNLRQVHLIQEELLDELQGRGFAVLPGEMGENITTRGLDLLALARGTRLHIGDAAIIEITGLRNPCAQLNLLQPGKMGAVIDRAEDGALVRRAGVMAIVISDGDVRPDDPIRVELPPEPRGPLQLV